MVTTAAGMKEFIKTEYNSQRSRSDLDHKPSSHAEKIRKWPAKAELGLSNSIKHGFISPLWKRLAETRLKIGKNALITVIIFYDGRNWIRDNVYIGPSCGLYTWSQSQIDEHMHQNTGLWTSYQLNWYTCGKGVAVGKWWCLGVTIIRVNYRKTDSKDIAPMKGLWELSKRNKINPENQNIRF